MDRGAWRAAVHGVTRLSRVHESGGKWVGSNKVVELKKKITYLRVLDIFSTFCILENSVINFNRINEKMS